MLQLITTIAKVYISIKPKLGVIGEYIHSFFQNMLVLVNHGNMKMDQVIQNIQYKINIF